MKMVLFWPCETEKSLHALAKRIPWSTRKERRRQVMKNGVKRNPREFCDHPPQLSECCRGGSSRTLKHLLHPLEPPFPTQPHPRAFPSTSPGSGPSLISDWGVVIYQIQTDKSFIKSRSKYVNSRRVAGGVGSGEGFHGWQWGHEGGRCSCG